MRSNRSVALQLVAIVAGMIMLVVASVPLYRLFCQVTGFAGTAKRAESALLPKTISNRRVNVTFDANVDPKLPWEFSPIDRSIEVRIGESKLVAFRAHNSSNEPTRGTATYNVTPYAVAKYFIKVQCFCFNEQHLAPGQTANLPVSFFIDPAYLDDPETRDITNITLSYTFFSYESANKSKL